MVAAATRIKIRQEISTTMDGKVVSWGNNYFGPAVPAAPAAASVNLPRRSESSAGRVRLQARDAAVPRGHNISDLIDFVRSGPQLDKENSGSLHTRVYPQKPLVLILSI
ncbi:uncharacterized protein LY89DRAFT_727352 [Mollisia scopiformis]|uniref:Uncharacterized protein n=1 Tax=Mollisia scopiformis TaxID=149040 RepID=A0A194XVG6_MOLSC|nr:uncharacterized protein LY89DRAFT_727352 [Mollisia scopiformis]KUJ24320.1 hypothetical protein LY89DRAFT_727352 [Mollisia scopiformis]